MMSSNHRGLRHSIGFFPILLLLSSGTVDMAAGQQQTPPDPYANYTHISPAMAVVVLVLIAALLFMGFFSIYMHHCNSSRADASVGPLARWRGAMNAMVARGLDASVIESFPTFVYAEVKSLKIGKGALECAVCLDEFEDDETLRLLPKCDHVFHPHCIGEWLESHVTCPVCRANLADPDQSVQETQTDTDVEAGRTETQPEPELETAETVVNGPPEHPRMINVSESLKGSRTRGSRSGRARRKFLQSHSTGHSLVQPGENTERFTLRVPIEVRKQIMANRKLNRANSLVVLPREGSSRRGKRVELLGGRSGRWLSVTTPSFLWRNSSFKSPKVVADYGEGTSVQPAGTVTPGGDSVRSDRWTFLKTSSFLWRDSSVKSPRVVGKDSEGSSVQRGGPVTPTGATVQLPV